MRVLLDFASFTGPVMRNSHLEVTPVIPGSLSRLPELAANLFFSWHRPTRALFEDLDPELWKQTNGNPRLVLRCVNQETLERCARDELYLARYHLALETLEAYLGLGAPTAEAPLVAYFCAEYGFQDRKSTRLNSSHSQISYAVFCLKKKIITTAHHWIACVYAGLCFWWRLMRKKILNLLRYSGRD